MSTKAAVQRRRTLPQTTYPGNGNRVNGSRRKPDWKTYAKTLAEGYRHGPLFP